MLGEHRNVRRSGGEVTETETIVGDDGVQRGGEVVEEGPGLKLRLERPTDGRETDEEVGPGASARYVTWRCPWACLPGDILSDKPGVVDDLSRPSCVPPGRPAGAKPSGDEGDEHVVTGGRHQARRSANLA